jgi:DHA2 family multidrug resistance protein-like MFS transporter
MWHAGRRLDRQVRHDRHASPKRSDSVWRRSRRGLHSTVAIASVLAAMVLVVLDAAIANVALPTIARSLHVPSATIGLDHDRLPDRPGDGPAAQCSARGEPRVFAGSSRRALRCSLERPVLCALSPSHAVARRGPIPPRARGCGRHGARRRAAARRWFRNNGSVPPSAGTLSSSRCPPRQDRRLVRHDPVRDELALAVRRQSAPGCGGAVRHPCATRGRWNGAPAGPVQRGAECRGLCVIGHRCGTPAGKTGAGRRAGRRSSRHPRDARSARNAKGGATDPARPAPCGFIPDFSDCSVLCFSGVAASLVALPFYLQHGLGLNAWMTGLYMTPWPLTVAIAAPLAGRLADRVSTARLCVAGAVCLAIGLAALALWPLRAHPLQLVMLTMLCGLGFGFFQVPNNRNMLLSVPGERSGAAGGMQGTARLVGQTAGAIIMTQLFTLTSLFGVLEMARVGIVLFAEAPRVAFEVAVALDAFGGELSAQDGRTDGAAGLAVVGAVVETTVPGESIDVLEAGHGPVRDDGELAHSGGVDQERTRLEHQELSACGGVPTLRVARADHAHVLSLLAEQRVDQARFAHSGGSDEGHRLSWQEALRERLQTSVLERAGTDDVDPADPRGQGASQRLELALVAAGEVDLVQHDDRCCAPLFHCGDEPIQAARPQRAGLELPCLGEGGHDEHAVEVRGDELGLPFTVRRAPLKPGHALERHAPRGRGPPVHLRARPSHPPRRARPRGERAAR